MCRWPSATTSSWQCWGLRARARPPCSTSSAALTITTTETCSSTACPQANTKTAIGTRTATTASASCSRPITLSRIRPFWKTSSLPSRFPACPAPSAVSAPSRRSAAWGLPSMSTRSLASFPAARCSASPSPVRSSTTPRSCWPTSLRARSTPRPACRSWTCSPKSPTTAWSSWSRTIPSWRSATPRASSPWPMASSATTPVRSTRRLRTPRAAPPSRPVAPACRSSRRFPCRSRTCLRRRVARL